MEVVAGADETSATTTGTAPQQDDRPAAKRARSSFDKKQDRQAGGVGGDLTPTMEQADQSGPTRYTQDPLDYPRRRAVIACEICRSRKSRCDGTRPSCRLCSELGADCVYREPGVKLDAGDRLILEQLARIEGLLHNNLAAPAAAGASHLGPLSPATSNPVTEDYQAKRINSTGTAGPSKLPLNGVGTWSANISTMPKTHTTPALHLLQWPVIRDLISRPCDPQVLMQLEMAREPLNISKHYSLDFTNIIAYTEAFFERANVWYAVVNPYTWRQYYRAAAQQDFRSGAESCVVLLVFALGQAARSDSISRFPHGQTAPGMDFFAAAWDVLPSQIMRNDVTSTQCHILAAAYLLYLVRPLEAWNLLCNASMKQQLMLSSPHCIPPPLKELSERIYWNTLMIESDLLAELDLPHSGIVQYEESMRLPRSFPYDAVTSAGDGDKLPGNDDLWYFLAEIALRRLLNRVSHLIYAHKRSTSLSVASLEPIVAELDYQLAQWYEGLPAPVKFPRDRLPARDQIQTVLRLRYFACRTIIFRPYIQAVLADESVAHEPGVQDACRKCLEACIRQLEYVSAHHEGHLPYLWQGALSVMSQTLLLMGATLSATLSQLLPPGHQMDDIIAEAVAEVERLSHLAPSLRLCAEIVREAEARRQVLIQAPKR